MLLGSGCAWTGKDGAHHVLILGVGVVSTFENGPVQVQDRRTGGLTLEPTSFSVGLVRQHMVVIDPERAGNAVISISARPFSLKVKNFDPFSEDSGTSNTTFIVRRNAP